jgi:hypothetical protein
MWYPKLIINYIMLYIYIYMFFNIPSTGVRNFCSLNVRNTIRTYSKQSKHSSYCTPPRYLYIFTWEVLVILHDNLILIHSRCPHHISSSNISWLCKSYLNHSAVFNTCVKFNRYHFVFLSEFMEVMTGEWITEHFIFIVFSYILLWPTSFTTEH